MVDDTEVQSWWDKLHWETKGTLVVGRYWRNMSSEEQDEVRHNYMLIRAGVNPIDDVDSGNLLDVVTDLMTRIDDALENIESYIPEFYRDDLKKILKGMNKEVVVRENLARLTYCHATKSGCNKEDPTVEECLECLGKSGL